MFEIVPRETILQKAVKPVTTALRRSSVDEADKTEDVQEKKTDNTLFVVITVTIVLALGSIAGVVRWRKKKNLQKDRKEKH